MRLLLIHGRFDPAEDMNDWGFEGPSIDGVEAIHVTYQSTYVLWFHDRCSCARAHDITGWPYVDDKGLEMQFHQDLLKAICFSADGPVAYYGDWELQIPRS